MIIRHAGPRAVALNAFAGAGERALFEEYARAEMQGFGGAFGQVDTAAAAVALIGKVRLAYGAGGAVQKIFPLDWQDALSRAVPVVDLLIPGMLTSPSKGALAKTYRELGVLIDDWTGRKFRWASQGKRDDGTPYSWQQWGDLGKTYLDSIIYNSALPLTDGFIANAFQALKEFLASLRTVFTPTEWPLWAKAAVTLAGVGAVAYLVRQAADSVRSVRRAAR